MANLRAILSDLRISAIVVTGGARDVVFELPAPTGTLPLRIEGGLSGGTVRRPAAIPVSVQIEGGAQNLRLDDAQLGAIGGVVLQHTAAHADSDDHIALSVLGGATELTVEPLQPQEHSATAPGSQPARP